MMLVLLLVGAAGVITLCGTFLVNAADSLAEKTGIGQAITGGLFLGAATSLPGLAASFSAAISGYPEMAVSNAVGGIAAQTAFLGIADIFYRRANLEHAAASLANLMQAGLLISLLCVPLIAANLPDTNWLFSVHPASYVMVVTYLFGMKLVNRSHHFPMWRPKETDVTQTETGESDKQPSGTLIPLWGRFIVLGLIVAVAGWLVAQLGIALVNKTGLSESLVGGLFTAVSSSLPELVTSIAAVRQKAYTLCVGGIIGGNAFDTLFVAVADAGYRPGSIFHPMTSSNTFLIVISILMTSILMLGLLSREKRGIANIGFESFTILLLYVVAVGRLFFA